MEYRNLASEENKKNIMNLSFAEFAQRVVKVKIFNLTRRQYRRKERNATFSLYFYILTAMSDQNL